jgi:archaellum biogenesis ATPase FlaH
MAGEYSLEQQKLIIEALLTDRELFVRSQAIMLPIYFNKQYQKTIKFIMDFAEKYNSVPTPEQIKAETGIELTLLEAISPEHQAYFLDEIESFCKHMALTNAILKGAELLEKGDYGNIEKLVKDALLVGLHKDMGVDYFLDPKDRLNKLRDSNGSIQTGLAALDQKIYNMNRGELLLLAAPSNGGKSMTMQNLMLNFALQGLNTIYITFEMSAELCAMRIDTMLTGIPTKEIFKKLDEVELNVKMAGKRCGKMFFKDMPHSTNTRDIRSYLKEFHIQNGFMPDVVLIDYLDLMNANDKRINPSDVFIKDKFVSEELRAMAKEFKILAVTASQFNRSASDGAVIEFNQSMIAGGKSKIDTCDNVIGIYLTQKMKERGEIEFQLLKTRNSNGVGQKIILAYDENCMRITDMDPTNTAGKNPTSSSVMDRINRKPKPSTTSNVDADTSDAVESNPISAAKAQDPVARAQSLNKLIQKVKKD